MLKCPVETIKGIGKARAAQLKKLGIETVGELLYALPRDYRDLTALKPIDQMREGEDWFGEMEIEGEPKTGYIRKGFSFVRTKGTDETGSVDLLWYNMPYIRNSLKAGKRFYAFGKPSRVNGRMRLNNPMLEAPETTEGLRLLPVYRLVRGLSQSAMRKCVRSCLDAFLCEVENLLPGWIYGEFGLMEKRQAVYSAHFPKSFEERGTAVKTLAFEELLLLKIYLASAREDKAARKLTITDEEFERFALALPFELTPSQKNAMEEMRTDAASGKAMNRLLQGDVGSGKTIVAFFLLYCAAKRGLQAAMIAPTEILALQHFARAKEFFDKFGMRTALLTGATASAERALISRELSEGSIDIIIGTHALLSGQVEFKDLAAIVTDEQHRFGVRQRAAFSEKGTTPHTLIMSATPIPRTLAMIVYADLSISTLSMPQGKKAVETHIVQNSKRSSMYEFVRRQALSGRQAYVVCPSIEESEDAALNSAKGVFKELKQKLEGVSVGYMSGELSGKEKARVLEAFTRGDIAVLISTTVVEVGMDVANATVMVVENAERFGLAQLHQLRGRVGRGSEKSWCFLCTKDSANERLRTLEQSGDGFFIAQKDLEQRGPGELLGTMQHGGDLRLSRYLNNAEAILSVEKAFDRIICDKDGYALALKNSLEKFGAANGEIAFN